MEKYIGTKIVKATPMTFGLALERLKNGGRVARKGWNGKGMYLFLVDGLEFHSSADLPEFNDTPVFVHPTIAMRTAQRTILIGWQASQTDMLADDWVLVE